ncbi:MAG: ABC transporter permease [Alicyclobacillus macrosporangiidus]|uniref:ABC transporter permease n=1 Tax=Alicyclobacillus macrosporangiidus TaxID=392015 RepID=UPI0026EA298F|nr:ABC transporter permease [Alicyclobacillus macrosporangiidus]MCL6600722.1 ABC transporter permease [Alicyclobacillus macrosporangiidus]
MKPIATSAPTRTNVQRRSIGTVAKVYLATFVLFVLSFLIQPNYLSWDHVMQTLVFASFLGIIAIGQTLVILTGGIDLSVAYVLNLGSVMLTQLTPQIGGVGAAVVVCLTGIIIGLLNGVGVAWLGIAPLIMTLGMNSIVQGLTLVYTNGTPKGTVPNWIKYVGTGSVLDVKVSVIVWAILAVVTIFILTRTTFGRKVYAVGNSWYTAYLSGIESKSVLTTVYAVSGLTAAIAGMVITGFLNMGYLGMGDAYQLPSIAAVVIGGTSILGGLGGYTGTVAGAIIIYVLQSILTVIHIQDAGRDIIYGLVILLVLFMYGRERQQV